MSAADLVDIAITLQAGDWADDAEGLILKAARAALDDTFDEAGGPAEMSIVLADDEAVRALNRDFRGKDKPTNVLSFAFLDDESDSSPDPDAPIMLGDIVLSLDTLRREAVEQGKPLSRHLTHLVIHGVLHLLGHDHLNDDEAERMEALETGILGRLGVPDPYARPPDVEPDATLKPGS